MTAYFDQLAVDVRDLFKPAGTDPHFSEATAICDFEHRLMRDMALVCEFDRTDDMAFPAGLRDKVCAALLKHCTQAWPCDTPYGGPDYETNEEGRRLLARAIEDLHDIFHEAAHAGWPGGDNPRTPMMVCLARQEERMAELVLAAQAISAVEKTTFVPAVHGNKYVDCAAQVANIRAATEGVRRKP